MAVKSTPDRYGSVAILLHWISALLILALIGSGFRASGIEDPIEKASILRLHLPLGIAVMVMTLVRIAWWVWIDNRPTPLPTSAWQGRTARFVHVLFYVVVLGMAASGIGMMMMSGAGPIIFADAPEALPNFMEFPPRIPHGIGARVLLALFALHVGAALYHHVFLKDGLISRIWFRSEG